MTHHGACGHSSSRSMWPWRSSLPSLLAQRVMTGNNTIKLLLVSPVRPQQGVAARPGVHPWLGLGSTLVNSPFYCILIDSSTDMSAEDHLPAQYLDADVPPPLTSQPTSQLRGNRGLGSRHQHLL